jgi:acetyl-CoA carboxylase carboxyltransferase component
MKQTAVEWLIEQINNVKPHQFCSIETIKEWCEEAKEMEKQQSQKYAEFAIHCDRNNLPILTFEDFIKL